MTDIKAVRGDTETYELAIVDALNQPVDLTGSTIWFSAKRNHADADADALIAKKTGGAGIVIDADQVNNRGKAIVTLLPADTISLSPVTTRLVYDVQVKEASGAISTPISGYLDVAPDVTQATT